MNDLSHKVFQKNTYVFLSFVLLAIVAYFRVVKGEFFFDDDTFILFNEHVTSLQSVTTYFTSSVTEGAGIMGNFYRPWQVITHALLYYVFGVNPIPFHLVQIILHGVNAFLVFKLLQKLDLSRQSSIIGGLIFLLHPIQTEAVAYISGLADPLGLCFLLGGMLFYLNAYDQDHKKLSLGHVFASLILFAMALFTKELAVIFPILAILLSSVFWKKYSSQEKSVRIKMLLVFLGMSLVYTVLKLTVFNFTGQGGLTSDSTVYTDSIFVRLITFVGVIWNYLKLIIFPWDLFYEKPYEFITSPVDLGFIAGVVILLAVLYLAYDFYHKDSRVSLGILWFLVALMPFSGILPLNAIYLEHWLYVPMIGVCILAAIGIDYVRKTGDWSWVKIILLIILGLMLWRTSGRAAQWGNPIDFYQNEINRDYVSARMYSNLGIHYADAGAYSASIRQYQRAIEISDTYPETRYNLANTYIQTNQLDLAVENYYLSLKIDPNFIYSLNALYRYYDYVEDKPRTEAFANLLLKYQADENLTWEEISAVRDMKQE